MIRKQKNEEEEILAKKNTGIIEIKVNNQNPYFNSKKSKSLTRKKYLINNRSNSYKNENITKDRDLKKSNSNHNFVNINLCKDKENVSVVYINSAKLNINDNSISHKMSNIVKEKKEFLTPINKVNSINNNRIHQINKSYSDLNLNLKNNNIINLNKNLNKENIIKNNYNSVNLSEDEKSKDNLILYPNQTKEYFNGIYDGIILNNKREIKGTMIYNNGAKYVGEWRNDKKNGKGIFITSNYFNCKNKIGMKFEGEFKDDKIEGIGIGKYSNGDLYEGEWKNYKPYGRGKVLYIGGASYEGEWMNGKFEGLGVFYLKNGEKFEGRFSDSKYNGYGKYYYNNGDYLEGIFQNDRPTGNCLLHKTDGQIIELAHN